MTNPNDPAFSPELISNEKDPSNYGLKSQGLTKREYFAAMAMQSLCVSYEEMSHVAAEWATKYADALIKELNNDQV